MRTSDQMPDPARPGRPRLSRRVATALMIAGGLGAAGLIAALAGTGEQARPPSSLHPTPPATPTASPAVLGTAPPALRLLPRLAEGSVIATLQLPGMAAGVPITEGLGAAGSFGHDMSTAYPGEAHSVVLVAGPGLNVPAPPPPSDVVVTELLGTVHYRVVSRTPVARLAASPPDAPDLRLTFAGPDGAVLVIATLTPSDPEAAAEIAQEVQVTKAEAAVPLDLPATPPKQLLRPCPGPISQGFGPTPYGFELPFVYQGVLYPHFHTGIDIAAPIGTPVRAAATGTVILATTNLANGVPVGYGTYVVISHGGGTYTLYGHLSRVLVRPGQQVAQGDVIGLVGSTGNSTGPHLHFELRSGRNPVDPVPYL